MKKLILSACVITCISFSASFGQSPTTQQADSTSSQTPYENKDSKFFQKDMTKVEQADIPAPIKESLKNREFKGWEKGKMFRSADGQTYLLQMPKGSNAKMYRFDPQGKEIAGNNHE